MANLISIRYLAFLGLLLFFACPLPATEEPIRLSRDEWKKMAGQLEYPDTKPLKEPLIEKNSGNIDFSFIRPLLYVLLIAGILFVLVSILRNNPGTAAVGKERAVAATLEEAEENLPEVELENIYQQALQGADYRSALRIRFLMLLQSMLDARLIKWQKRKTNEQYLAEIGDPQIRSPFASIVVAFDNSWYGNSTLTPEFYKQINQHIESFTQRIKAYDLEK